MRTGSCWRVTSGNQSDASPNIDELALITEAAYVRAHTIWHLQRAVAQRQASLRDPAGGGHRHKLRGAAKSSVYETLVVSNFCELVLHSAALLGREVFWEVKEGEKFVDVILAGGQTSEEKSLIEFGYFTPQKVMKEAKKLVAIKHDSAFKYTTRYIVSFKENNYGCQEQQKWIRDCKAAAEKVTDANVVLRAASSQTIFAINSLKPAEMRSASEPSAPPESGLAIQRIDTPDPGKVVSVAIFTVTKI